MLLLLTIKKKKSKEAWIKNYEEMKLHTEPVCPPPLFLGWGSQPVTLRDTYEILRIKFEFVTGKASILLAVSY